METDICLFWELLAMQLPGHHGQGASGLGMQGLPGIRLPQVPAAGGEGQAAPAQG
jgi:hypothetical protein